MKKKFAFQMKFDVDHNLNVRADPKKVFKTVQVVSWIINMESLTTYPSYNKEFEKLSMFCYMGNVNLIDNFPTE